MLEVVPHALLEKVGKCVIRLVYRENKCKWQDVKKHATKENFKTDLTTLDLAKIEPKAAAEVAVIIKSIDEQELVKISSAGSAMLTWC